MARKKRILTDEEKLAIKIAKAELNEYKEDIKYLKKKMDNIEEVKTLVTKITATWSHSKTSQTNKHTDKFAEALSKIEGLSEDVTEKLKDLLIKKFEIDEKIDSLPQPYRNVLFFRYSSGMGWGSVAEELGYAESHVYEIHRNALYLYSKIKSP